MDKSIAWEFFGTKTRTNKLVAKANPNHNTLCLQSFIRKSERSIEIQNVRTHEGLRLSARENRMG